MQSRMWIHTLTQFHGGTESFASSVLVTTKRKLAEGWGLVLRPNAGTELGNTVGHNPAERTLRGKGLGGQEPVPSNGWRCRGEQRLSNGTGPAGAKPSLSSRLTAVVWASLPPPSPGSRFPRALGSPRQQVPQPAVTQTPCSLGTRVAGNPSRGAP